MLKLAGSGDYIEVRFLYQLLTQSRVKLSTLTNNNMFHLVQQDPGETVLLGSYETQQTALFKLGQQQMRNPHCFYEIMTSDDIKELNS